MKREHVFLLVGAGAVLALVVLVGGGALVWHLSQDDEDSSWTASGSTRPSANRVIINGRPVDESQIEALKARYGRYPAEGNFWYDPVSGLFGNVGASSAGFMYPGHDFGPLDPKASNGNTGVFLNGREFALDEYAFFSVLASTPIQPGRYWMNHRGDVGYEGLDLAIGNLYVAVQQRLQGGGRAPNGRGDNFWWTRFSAGNSNEDNSAGYVALPNGGFASYGM